MSPLTVEHEARTYLDTAFVRYVETNLPQRARDHFFGLKEAMPDLIGIAIFDRLEKELRTEEGLMELMWRCREIENYFCLEEVLLAYALYDVKDDLFGDKAKPRGD